MPKRSRSAGYEIVISVEAMGRSRPASVEWVEQMVYKHKDLPTSKLVLVAEKGFSPQARALAEAEGVAALAPEDLRTATPPAKWSAPSDLLRQLRAAMSLDHRSSLPPAWKASETPGTGRRPSQRTLQ